ncbi:MAG: glycosyltransferase family 2 protein [Vicinamibacterales bacterium]
MAPIAISVITLTRLRAERLFRAIRTVAAQTGVRVLEHLVLIDDCARTHGELAAAAWLPTHLRWSVHSRSADDRTGPTRVATLRNLGVRHAAGTHVAFLDDDNEWAPDHLATLVACMERSGCPAVHSHLTIHWPDGRPYLEPRLPWARDARTAAEKYDALVRAGVWTRGSNIVRDRVDPEGCRDPIRTVDMGAWLFTRALLDELPFRTDYGNGDWTAVTTEDDKLLDDLVRRRIPTACTSRPTLKYVVGGYSNHWLEGDDAWRLT